MNVDIMSVIPRTQGREIGRDMTVRGYPRLVPARRGERQRLERSSYHQRVSPRTQGREEEEELFAKIKVRLVPARRGERAQNRLRVPVKGVSPRTQGREFWLTTLYPLIMVSPRTQGRGKARVCSGSSSSG